MATTTLSSTSASLAGQRLAPRALPPAAAFLPAARPRQARALRVRANWGAPVEFKGAKVLESTPEAQQLQRIKLDLGGLASTYTIAGQFIQAKTSEEGKAGFFAIASPPGDKENGAVELLIKAAGETAEQVVATPSGAELLVSAPMGKGFPIDRIPAPQFHTVLLFATGSGISPIKALIESSALQADKRRVVKLYYGVRTPAHLAYKESIPAWEAAGVTVVPVFSEEGQGYIQEAFARDAAAVPESDWSGVAAVLCGHKGMAEAVTELLGSKGVAKEHVLLNF